MRFVRLVLGTGLAISLAACAGADVPRPTTFDASRTNIPLARLEQGRAVYLDKCTRCHTPIGPRDVLAGDWPGHVANMAERSKISGDEQQIIVDYLVTVAPPGQTPIPGGVTPGAAPATVAPPPAAVPAPAPPAAAPPATPAAATPSVP